MAIDIDFERPNPPKCKHCGKDRGKHSAVILHCPVGMKTRVGYTQFHNSQTYEPRATHGISGERK